MRKIKDVPYSNRNSALKGKSFEDLPKFDINKFPRRINLNPEHVIKYPRQKKIITESDLQLEFSRDSLLRRYVKSYIATARINIQIARLRLEPAKVKKVLDDFASDFLFGKQKFYELLLYDKNLQGVGVYENKNI